MVFTYKNWDAFCCKLKRNGIVSITAREVYGQKGKYLVLKHDVETNVKRAGKMAAIEASYGHRGTYYVQAYLMNDPDNVKLLEEMKRAGHEISYHYDVLDSNKGDIEKAIVEFEKNKGIFETNGFVISTVCQHGNPMIERNGYASNRDFFRNSRVRSLYPEISDIMVDFKQKADTDYIYFSDAGRKFKMIFDPINNDITNSDEKNIIYDDLDAVMEAFSSDKGNIVSVHPHRWVSSATAHFIKNVFFKAVRFMAKLLFKIPVLKRMMSRYYFLAKKI